MQISVQTCLRVLCELGLRRAQEGAAKCAAVTFGDFSLLATLQTSQRKEYFRQVRQ